VQGNPIVPHQNFAARFRVSRIGIVKQCWMKQAGAKNSKPQQRQNRQGRQHPLSHRIEHARKSPSKYGEALNTGYASPEIVSCTFGFTWQCATHRPENWLSCGSESGKRYTPIAYESSYFPLAHADSLLALAPLAFYLVAAIAAVRFFTRARAKKLPNFTPPSVF